MNFDIFRAYDVRGIYPSDIDEEACYEIARAYAAVFEPDDVAVGMDARLSSPPLKAQIVRGLIDSGVNVIEIGEVTTDMLYFAVGAYGFSGGIIISASHNPGDYNGLKMVRERVTAISSDTGLYDIRDMLRDGGRVPASAEGRGEWSERDVIADYTDHVLGFVDTAAIRPFTVVANGNFGFVGRSVRAIAERLPLEIIPLNFEPDGSFPKGPPDPLLPDNRIETEQLVKKSGADFGVAWDADADRVMFFDETGRFISGAYITAFLASMLLEKYGRENNIIFDPRVTWPILKTVTEIGGQPIISKCGHAFIKDRMRSEDALFAGEMSAHYYFRDNFYADNGIIPFILLLEYLSGAGRPFSEVMRPFMEGHFMSGEINYRVADTAEWIAAVRDRFKDEGAEDYTDGYSVESAEWRFNIRPSNTEALLRLNVEAKREELVGEIVRRLESIIKKGEH